MVKQRSPIRRRGWGEELEPRNRWRDHPVILLAGAFAAGFAFAATIAVPIYSASLQAKLDAQARDIAQVRSLRASNADLQDQVRTLTIEQFRIATTKPFGVDDLRPVGHRVINIGDPAQRIETAYKGQPVNRADHGFYYIEPKHGFWRTIQIDTDEGQVTDIRWYARDRQRAEAALIAVFGPPAYAEEDEGVRSVTWQTELGSVRLYADQYSVYPKALGSGSF